MESDNDALQQNVSNDDLLQKLLIDEWVASGNNQSSRKLPNQLGEIEIIFPALCSRCGWDKDGPYHIQISSIKAQDTGWVASGQGNAEQVEVRCNMCWSYYMAIRQVIPILCGPFSCPKCGSSESLQYKINSVTTTKDSFQFEVEIECKPCSKKLSLKKVIKDILKVINVEIGPTGITVKKA